MRQKAIHEIESRFLRADIPQINPGDTVRVHLRIHEGEKSRVQVFEGVVLRVTGRGARATFTVRKVSFGIGVERIFPLFSPRVEKVEIASSGRVRRARLYYLRELSGKKARLKGIRLGDRSREIPASLLSREAEPTPEVPAEAVEAEASIDESAPAAD